MKQRFLTLYLIIALLAGVMVGPVSVARDGVLPDALSAAIIVKVLGFESSERSSASMRIHVLDDEKLAKQLMRFQGSSVRNRDLAVVTFGASIQEGADVVVASSGDSLRSAIAYAKEHGAITVTNNPELIALGAALIVYDDEGLPGILLDRDAAKRERLYWEPEILHIARMVGDL